MFYSSGVAIRIARRVPGRRVVGGCGVRIADSGVGPKSLTPWKRGELHKFAERGRAPLPALGRAADFAATAVFWTMRRCLLMGGIASRTSACGLFWRLEARS
jgi:hypothetical protein